MSYVHALRICLLKQVLFQVNFPHTKIFPFKELRKSQELGLKGFLHMIIKTWTKHTRIDTWLCTQTHACVWIHIQIHAHLYTCVHTNMWLWSGSFHYQTSSNPTPLTSPYPALSSTSRAASLLPAHPPQRRGGAAWSPHVSITLATSQFLYLTDHTPGPSYFISFQNILNYLSEH